MKIDFRSMTGFSLSIDIPPGATVLDAKKQIGTMRYQEFEPLQLVYGASILEDSTKIEDINYAPNTYVVFHNLRRPKLIQREKVEEPPQRPEPQPEIIEEPQQPVQNPPPVEEPIPEPVSPAPETENPKHHERSASKKKEYNFDPPNFDQLIAQLLEMGFPIEKCKHALRSYNYEVDRAADALLTSL